MTDRIEFGAFQLTPEIQESVNACLKSGWLTMGPAVIEFQERWKRLFSYKYARLLSSGTAADTACCMALYSYGAVQGDEVICPALSFIATANAIRAAGFKPVFVDVRKETLNIDETLIEQAITPKTRAIITVNLMGRPSELDVIQNLCLKYSLIHIVDNCEAYGSMFKGRFALDYADMETSSHFLAHIIFGVEGGVVSTHSNNMDELIEGIRSHGRMGGSNYFNHQIWGLNFKPSDLHASVALPEMSYYSFWDSFHTRLENQFALRDACRGAEDIAYFIEEDEDRDLAPHAFSITLKTPGVIHKLTQALDDANIAWKRNFGCMATQHSTFSYLGHRYGEFPNAEYIGNNGIHIGVHKLLSLDDLGRICTTLKETLPKCR